MTTATHRPGFRVSTEQLSAVAANLHVLDSAGTGTHKPLRPRAISDLRHVVDDALAMRLLIQRLRQIIDDSRGTSAEPLALTLLAEIDGGVSS
jgi:hypothetical protein